MPNQPKDAWDKFDLISKFVATVVFAAIAGCYTWQQSSAEKARQARNAEVETLSKFMPYLTGTDEVAKETALLAMGRIASKEFMASIATRYPSAGSVNALKKASAEASSTATEKKLVEAALVATQKRYLIGKQYSFGVRGSGADDVDIPPGATLALVEPKDLKDPAIAQYFTDVSPDGKQGLMARLNPKTLYLACRYDSSMISYLKTHLVTVRNPKDPTRSVQAKVVEKGPPPRPEYTDYVAAISPEVATRLGIKKGEEVEILLDVN